MSLKRNNIFQSATLKLTALYVGILVFICMLFSTMMYGVVQSRAEQRAKPSTELVRRFAEKNPQELKEVFRAQAEEDRQAFLGRLVILNIVVISGGSILSYVLAKKTLQPITQAHESQRRFAADAAHELRTPLTNIVLENQVLLRDTPKSAELKRQLRSNIEEAKRLTALTSGLLQLATLEGDIELRDEVNLSKMINDIASEHSQATVSSKTIARVHGNSDLLAQAIGELVNNSQKHNADGTQVQLRLKTVGNRAELTIEDDGQGIKPSETDQVFERLYQSSSATEGYGLGLALVQDIIQLHNGSIQLDRGYINGARFIISLPLD